MNANENIPVEVRNASIELGVASVETQGMPVGADEPLGFDIVAGISEG